MMGNFTSLAMSLAAQEEEEEVALVVSELEGGADEEEQELTEVVSEVEGGAGEEEHEVMEVVSEEEGGAGEEEHQDEQEGGHAKANDEVERVQDEPELQCSICLDAVVAGGEERSTARLQCGHEFHLDCIGSAFNAKGIMQCPNCRRIETGYWRYARGPHSSQGVSNDDWVSDEELDSNPEASVSLRFQWYPNDLLSDLPSLSEEVETSPMAAFVGLNINAEPIDPPGPSTTHQGAYLAYLQPLQPPVSSSSSNIIDRTLDGSAQHDQWISLAGPTDVQLPQRAYPIDSNHNPWALMPHSNSPPNNNGVTEQTGLSVGGIRIGGVDSTNQQRGSLPPFYGNGSGRPAVPPPAPQLIRAPGNINPRFEQGLPSLLAAGYQPLYGGVRPFGAGMIPRDGSLLPEGSSASRIVEEWAHSGPHSPVNNEGVWTSSSQQQQPPPGAPEPASARSPPSPPQENDNRSPDDTSFQ